MRSGSPVFRKRAVTLLKDDKRKQLYCLFGLSATLLQTGIGTFHLGTGRALVFLTLAMVILGLYMVRRPHISAHNVSLGAILLVGSVWGVIISLYNYEKNYMFVDFYATSRVYANVTPMENAGTTADAGTIMFNKEAYVDTGRSAGYIDGSGTYCIAPVVKDPQQKYVNFWVVGHNCCKPVGGFRCDAAANGMVKAGVVVFDSPQLFGQSEKSKYRLAKEKAEALHGFDMVPHDVQFLRWYDNKDVVSAMYYDAALWVYFGMALLFTAICYLMSHIIILKEKHAIRGENDDETKVPTPEDDDEGDVGDLWAAAV